MNEITYPTSKYPLSLRILHWLIALIIISLIAVGLIMADLPKDDPNRNLLFMLHKSFGVTVLGFAFLRLFIRLRYSVPPLPQVIPAIKRLMANMGHYALYGFMFAMPISGYVMTNSYGRSVPWFGLTMPKLWDIDLARGNVSKLFHEYAAYYLIGLITLHVGAVVLHFVKHRIKSAFPDGLTFGQQSLKSNLILVKH